MSNTLLLYRFLNEGDLEIRVGANKIRQRDGCAYVPRAAFPEGLIEHYGDPLLDLNLEDFYKNSLEL